MTLDYIGQLDADGPVIQSVVKQAQLGDVAMTVTSAVTNEIVGVFKAESQNETAPVRPPY